MTVFTCPTCGAITEVLVPIQEAFCHDRHPKVRMTSSSTPTESTDSPPDRPSSRRKSPEVLLGIPKPVPEPDDEA